MKSKAFTHAGKFHADDIFSTSLLRYLNPEIEVVRGFEVPEDFDGIVFDIGFGKFDHHQADAPKRENGTKYAAFGLLWREYGEQILGEDAERFDADFVEPLDIADNTGCKNIISELIEKFNPPWDSDRSVEEAFWKAEQMAYEILTNEFCYILSARKADGLLEKAIQVSDREVVVLEQFMPWKKKLCETESKLVIYPSNRGGYNVQGVPLSVDDTELRVAFPEEWRGKAKEELRAQTGIPGITFCHASGFLVGVETLEDAWKAARLALEKAERNNGKEKS